MNMSLKARLGRVPSTAAGTSGASRLQTFSVLRALPQTLPDGWRVRLLPDHQFRLEVETNMQAPTTASALVTQLTSFLLCLGPYLDALDEVGVVPNRS